MRTNPNRSPSLRLICVLSSLFAVFTSANALDHAYRAFQICPPGLLQQFGLGMMLFSGIGLVVSLGLAAISSSLLVIEFIRHTKRKSS